MPATRLYGLLAEFNVGVLRGFRLYFDAVPAVSGALPIGEARLGWQRLVVGRSFRWRPPAWPLALDAVAKAGVWRFQSRLPVEADDGSVALHDFSVDRGVSLGGEVGAQWRWTAASVRLWHARDVALPLIGAKLGTTVQSARSGVDIFARGFALTARRHALHLSFLGFAMAEDIGVKSSYAAAPPAVAPRKSASIEIISNYLGGGISLSW